MAAMLSRRRVYTHCIVPRASSRCAVDVDAAAQCVRLVHAGQQHTLTYDTVSVWPRCHTDDNETDNNNDDDNDDDAVQRAHDGVVTRDTCVARLARAIERGHCAALVVAAMHVAHDDDGDSADDDDDNDDELTRTGMVALDVYMHALHRLLCTRHTSAADGDDDDAIVRRVSVLTASADGAILVDELAQRRVAAAAQLQRVRVGNTTTTSSTTMTACTMTAAELWSRVVAVLARRHARHDTASWQQRSSDDTCNECNDDGRHDSHGRGRGAWRLSQSLCVVTISDARSGGRCVLVDVGDDASAHATMTCALSRATRCDVNVDDDGNAAHTPARRTTTVATTQALVRLLAQMLARASSVSVMAMPDAVASPSHRLRTLRFAAAAAAQSRRHDDASPLSPRRSHAAAYVDATTTRPLPVDTTSTHVDKAAVAATAASRERTRMSSLSLHGQTPSRSSSSSSSSSLSSSSAARLRALRQRCADERAARIVAEAQLRRLSRQRATTTTTATATDNNNNAHDAATSMRVARALVAGCAAMHAQLRRLAADTFATADTTTATTATTTTTTADASPFAVSTAMLHEHARAIAVLRRGVEDVLLQPSLPEVVPRSSVSSSSSSPVVAAATASDVEALARALALEQRRCAHLRSFLPTYAQLDVAVEHMRQRVQASKALLR